MKKQKLFFTVITVITIMLVFVCSAYASEEKQITSGDLTYVVLSDGTAKITSYKGNSADYTLPSKVGGKTVTVIGSYAFSQCSDLKKLTIPGSVKKNRI